MSFLIGKTQARSNVSGETSATHNALLDFIMKQGFGGTNPAPGGNQALLDPYRALFQQQNAMAGASAKESAGNLTGSGFANTLGMALGRNATEQGSFLATMLEQMRQNDANRYQNLVLGTLGSPAAGVQYTHTPGLLDYATQGAAAAAPFIAGGPKPLGAMSASTTAPGTALTASGQLTTPSGAQYGQASNYGFLNVPGYTEFMRPEGQGRPGPYGIGQSYAEPRDYFGNPNYRYRGAYQ